jgi:hypothetical protein
MIRTARAVGALPFRFAVCAAVLLCAAATSGAQQPPRPDGWVVIPVDDYRALRLAAYPAEPPPELPPAEATLSRLDYDLRVAGESAAGEARLTVDVLKEGWVRVEIPAGLLVRTARLDGRTLPIIEKPSPHVLLSKPGRVLIALDVVVPVKFGAGTETLTLPPSHGAVSRLALVVPRAGIDLSVSGGLLAEAAQEPDGRWVAFARGGEPLTVTWNRRTAERAGQPLRWKGAVTSLVGLGEDTSPITAAVAVDVTQGAAPFVEVNLPDGVVVNQVSGPMIADWEMRGGALLRINFLEPVPGQTSFSISAETRLPRDGNVGVPLIRLTSAERESGAVAVEVLGAGEIGDRQPRGLDPVDPSELAEPVRGRDAPSMVAFRYRPEQGGARGLSVSVARYTPQAVLIANVEEARYDVLVDEQGKTIVRARYAVRNNQRAFLGVTLPEGATLWSAAVSGRPLRPGLAGAGPLLLPLEKGRAGEETQAFAVELTYLQRTTEWPDKGRGTLVLPAVDLPIARTGVVLHHSPRFKITPEPGAFRVDADTGPFTAALRSDGIEAPARPAPPPAPEVALTITDVGQLRKDAAAGRTVTGPLPIRLPFPSFGPCVFLMSELTAEQSRPSIEFSYKRESRW